MSNLQRWFLLFGSTPMAFLVSFVTIVAIRAMKFWLSNLTSVILETCRGEDITSSVLQKRRICDSTILEFYPIALLTNPRRMSSSGLPVFETPLGNLGLNKALKAPSIKQGVHAVEAVSVPWVTATVLSVHVGRSTSVGCFLDTTWPARGPWVSSQTKADSIAYIHTRPPEWNR